MLHYHFYDRGRADDVLVPCVIPLIHSGVLLFRELHIKTLTKVFAWTRTWVIQVIEQGFPTFFIPAPIKRFSSDLAPTAIYNEELQLSNV